jgi:1,4-alpha-glucan branching enzyme
MGEAKTFIHQSIYMLIRFAPLSLLLISFIAKAQVSSVRLTVYVPALAETKNVFVAGSFNNWKAGDSLYKMKQLDAGTYTIILPVFKNAQYKYKYTLGNWNEVEIALNDSNINNRIFVCSTRKKKIVDTVIKWALPKPTAKESVSSQMAKFNCHERFCS